MKPSFSMSIKINWSYWWRMMFFISASSLLMGCVAIIISKITGVDLLLWAITFFSENLILITVTLLSSSIIINFYINAWAINKIHSVQYKNFQLSLMHQQEKKEKFSILDSLSYSLSVTWRGILIYLPITIIVYILDLLIQRAKDSIFPGMFVFICTINIIEFTIFFFVSALALHWTLTRKKTGRWLKIYPI